MSGISSSTSRFGADLLSELSTSNFKPKQLSRNLSDGLKKNSEATPSFSDHLENSLKSVNADQKLADQKATDLATGKETNIHETMLTASNAELTFNLMVQVRNKALEAYQEIMRMPV
jgi:flagellar hook-basal body complex protein FliE